MKTKLFGKAAALVMGSLMIVSGQTLAMESNKQEVTNAEALSNSELLVAQLDGLTEDELGAIGNLRVEAETIVGNILTDLDNIAESDAPGKGSVADGFVTLKTTIGNLGAQIDNKALTRAGGVAIANLIVDLSATVGNIAAVVKNEAITNEGRAVADSAIEASTKVGDIALKVENIAKSGGS